MAAALLVPSLAGHHESQSDEARRWSEALAAKRFYGRNAFQIASFGVDVVPSVTMNGAQACVGAGDARRIADSTVEVQSFFRIRNTLSQVPCVGHHEGRLDQGRCSLQGMGVLVEK